MSEQKSKIFISIVLGIIAILLISVLSFSFPVRAVIPLNVNFAVGEEMVYDTVRTTADHSSNYKINSVSTPLPNETIADFGKQIERVENFDGLTYTINLTMTNSVGQKRTSLMESITSKGQVTWHLPKVGNVIINATVGPYSFVPTVLEKLCSKPQAMVGDTWHIPYESNSGVESTGNLIITFNGVENLTVPAGTYKIFKVGIQSDNIKTHYTVERNRLEADLFPSFNIQLYLEYGTMRVIKYVSEGSVYVDPAIKDSSYLKMMQEYTKEEMVLIQHNQV